MERSGLLLAPSVWEKKTETRPRASHDPLLCGEEKKKKRAPGRAGRNGRASRVARTQAFEFGSNWAKQLFGARAENALVQGTFERATADGGVVAKWHFPDEVSLAESASLWCYSRDARGGLLAYSRRVARYLRCST